MLVHTNSIVDIFRSNDPYGYILLEDGGKIMLEDGTGFLLLEESPSPIYESISVYLQPLNDLVETGFDGEGAYKEFLMMTRGVVDIQIGDKVKLGSDIYFVRGAELHDDLTGKHMEFNLVIEYD